MRPDYEGESGMQPWIWGKGEGEGIVRECGVDRCMRLYLKWITNKDLL